MNYGSWLRREIPKWVEDGLMTKEAGNTLLLRYKKGRISLYTGHVILLAVISLLVGLFLYWQVCGTVLRKTSVLLQLCRR